MAIDLMSAAGLWRGKAPLLLASGSATRRGLLEAAGLPVEASAAGVDERAIEADLAGNWPGNAGLAPRLAQRLAREKALAIARRHPGRVVVGADQTLACAGRLFHTPTDLAAAQAQLAQLAGRVHTLHAAFAIARGEQVLHEGIEEARLTMRALGPEAIARYADVAGAGAVASVGGYRIEGLGIHLFERIEGEHSTILGLPLLPLLAALRGLDLLAF